ncbi:MFS transporter [Nocardia alba]|uniref:Putative MFS family arabinose efflux permease n=1 Tax=Nocardia alba TaxID=225051 RepID=A0A4R1FTA4_9NOCA|nr:MFS transporter [Nocardia alba]TCJ96952.1 putative MFS family arabinose efflux permease [Nocardia alba]
MADARAAAPTWDRRRWVLLLVLSGNMILDAIEGSILVPAFAVLTTGLGRSSWETQWLLAGFAAGFAALLLAGPTLAARFGRKRVYLAAMAVFAVASAVGGLTDDLTLLVATRVVKGAAAALTAPAGLAVIAAEFPAGTQQRRAISVYAVFGAAGFTTGLLLSGWLAALNWHLLFVFPAPVAIVLLIAGWRVIPDAPVSAPPRLSKALVRNGSLVRSALGAAALNGGYLSLLVVLAVQLHDVLGWSPWQIALGLLPASVPLAVSVPFAGRYVARFGTAPLILAGAVATLAGHLLLFARPDIGDYRGGVLPVLLLVEAGFVLSFAALNMQSTATVAPELRPIAVPLYQTGVQFGAALVLPLTVGVAVAVDAYRPAAAVIALAGLLAVAAASGEFRATRRPSANRDEKRSPTNTIESERSSS